MMTAQPAAHGLALNGSADATGRKNMLLLIQLRWIAVAGQLATILLVHFAMGIRLPLAAMLLMPAASIALNLASLAVLRSRRAVANVEIFLALMFDVAALAIQLYLSGGATNPFVSLFLVQVVLGAVLLDRWSVWAIVGVSSLCVAGLALVYRPLRLPERFADNLFDMHIAGAWICFVLNAILLVLFMTRISRNLRLRDARLAELRQRAAEEDHIVRMGLLASGAAHELGTPLSSLAVILSDWRRMPAFARRPQLVGEIEEMQAEVRRCKAIVSGILLSAGEARGEASAATTVRAFVEGTIAEWLAGHPDIDLDQSITIAGDVPIVADRAIKQVIDNVLENAAEASPAWIGVAVTADDETLKIVVRDRGPGFAPEMLDNLGKPYRSSKGRAGSGLGLFLVVNVMRKLGGEVVAENAPGGGAIVTLTLPLATLAIAKPPHHV